MIPAPPHPWVCARVYACVISVALFNANAHLRLLIKEVALSCGCILHHLPLRKLVVESVRCNLWRLPSVAMVDIEAIALW
eukprot:5881179-Amphidinium_carterae.1